jgi:5'-methylthioadenosine phosphorylase
MTNLQEAKLAREAEICYTTLALVTDYDCWHPDHASVTVDMIISEPDAEREDGAAGDCQRGRASCRSSARANAHAPWPRRSSRGLSTSRGTRRS